LSDKNGTLRRKIKKPLEKTCEAQGKSLISTDDYIISSGDYMISSADYMISTAD